MPTPEWVAHSLSTHDDENVHNINNHGKGSRPANVIFGRSEPDTTGSGLDSHRIV